MARSIPASGWRADRMSGMHASVATAKRPGVFMGSPAAKAAAADQLPVASDERSQARVIWDAFAAHLPARISLFVMLALALACIALPWVLPWSATESDFHVLAATPPSAAHPLGTDKIGRDVLAR